MRSNLRINFIRFIIVIVMVLFCHPMGGNAELQFITGDVANSFLGASVSISADYAIVGSPRDEVNANRTGSAYILQQVGGNWIKQAKIMANDSSAYDNFGCSVSISGDYAIVGARSDANKGANSGSAYIFKRNGTQWVQQQPKLLASDGTTGDYFGTSVCISGNYAIIGAPNNSSNGYNAGAAYIFEFNGTTWSQKAKLTGKQNGAGDQFGTSVSIYADSTNTYAIVGALSEDVNISMDNVGAAYIFIRGTTDWVKQTRIIASGGTSQGYNFGTSVSIAGDYAIVGASGGAFIYQKPVSGWPSSQSMIETSMLIASDEYLNDYFGKAVSIFVTASSVIAVVGAPNHDNKGSAYIFESPVSGLSPIMFETSPKLIATGGMPNDNFGKALSISDSYVIVGADGVDSAANSNIGAAYIYAKNSSLTPLLSVVSDQNIPVNTSKTINFTVGDETAVNLTVSVYSNNPALVPPSTSNIKINGGGAVSSDGTSVFSDIALKQAPGTAPVNLNIIPMGNQTGSSLLTVTVSRTAPAAAAVIQTTFTLTVNYGLTIISALPDQLMAANSTLPVSFKLGGIDSPPQDPLTITAASDNNALLPTDPPGTFTFDVDPTDPTMLTRIIKITPALNLVGEANITIQVDNGIKGNTSKTFHLTVNQSPRITIDDIPDIPADPASGTPPTYIAFQNTSIQNTSKTINYSITDRETLPENLNVTATCDNSALFPAGSLMLNGIESKQTIILTPALNSLGKATITLTVDDGSGLSNAKTSTSFVVKVNINPPTVSIAPGAPQIMASDSSVKVNFIITENDIPLDTLKITASSDNPALLPPTSPNTYVFTGTSSDRIVTITPAPGQTGNAKITITVDDGINKPVSTTFPMTVNQSPTITLISPDVLGNPAAIPPTLTTYKYSNINNSKTINFTVADETATPDKLNPTYTYDNRTLFPAGSINMNKVDNNGSWAILYNPAAYQSGEAIITLTVDDGSGLSNAKTSISFVIQVSYPPTISNVPTTPQLIAMNAQLIVNFNVGVINTTLDKLSITASSDNPELLPTAAANTYTFSGISTSSAKTLTITPAANQTGTAKITITVNDGISATPATASFTLTVNQAPTITLITSPDIPGDPTANPPILPTYITNENIYRTIDFTASDQETILSQSNLTYSCDKGILFPAGSISLTSTGGIPSSWSIKFTPALNQSDTAVITLTVDDHSGASNAKISTSFKLWVKPVIYPPTISNVPTTPQLIAMNAQLIVNFNVGDTNTTLDKLNITASSDNPTLLPLPPANTYLIPITTSSDKTLTITPAANQTGTAKITITVNDGICATPATASFTLTVNHAPTIALITFPDIPGDPTANPPILPTYITNENIYRTIDFTASDQETILSQSNLTYSCDKGILFPAGSISLTSTGGIPSSWSIKFTPALNQSDTAVITLTVDDHSGASNAKISTSFKLWVKPVIYPPTISNVPTTPQLIAMNAQLIVNFNVGDTNTTLDKLNITVSSDNPTLLPQPPANTYLIPITTSSDKTLTITPAVNQTGTAKITITVNDGISATPATASFTLMVNQSPTITLITSPDIPGNAAVTPPILPTYNTDENIPINIKFTASDWEAPLSGSNLTCSCDNRILFPYCSNQPSAEGTSGWSITLTPALNQTGTAIITLTADDGSKVPNAKTSTSFNLKVNPVIYPPTISIVTNVTNPIWIAANSQLTVNFTVGDTNTTLDKLNITVSSDNPTLLPQPPANTYLIPITTSSDKTLTITPAVNQTGTAKITITVNDGISATPATASFTLMVNQSPTITLITSPDIPGNAAVTPPILPTYNTDENIPINIKFTASDWEAPLSGSNLTCSCDNRILFPYCSNQPSAEGTSGWSITLTPALNQTGTAIITLTADDGSKVPNAKTSTSFNLKVNPVIYPPTISIVTNVTNPIWIAANSQLTVNFTVGDTNTTLDKLNITVSSDNPTLLPQPPANTYLIPITTSSDKTLTITPAVNQTGTAKITITVNDGISATPATASFTLMVNQSPTITLITSPDIPGNAAVTPPILPTYNTDENIPINIKFTASDWEAPLSGSNLTCSCDNRILFPYCSNQPSAEGTSGWSITLTPALNQTGTAIITLTADDGSKVLNAKTSTSFILKVNPVFYPPTISIVTDVTNPIRIAANSQLVVNFTVGDTNTTLDKLKFTASSDNLTLLPPSPANSYLFSTGSASARTLTITPAVNQAGTAKITITVDDGIRTTSAPDFTLEVNQAPTITLITSPDIPGNSAVTPPILPTYNIDENNSINIKFTASDPKFILGADNISRSWDNGILFPAGSIGSPILAGTPNTWSITLTPALNQIGTAIITLTADNGAAKTSTSFIVSVNKPIAPPTISVLQNSIYPIPINGQLVVNFTVGDTNTTLDKLKITASSNNPTLLPPAPANTYLFGGTGSTRTLTITPAANQIGTAQITITVDDGVSKQTASASFSVTVNQAPTILLITSPDAPGNPGVTPPIPPTYKTNQNTSRTIDFTVGDPETAQLLVTYASDNGILFPAGSITVVGNTGNRTVTCNPASNQTGTAIITLTVDDNSGASNAKVSTSFILSVNKIIDPPTISILTNTVQPIAMNSHLIVNFTVGDNNTALDLLKITASSISDNPLLLPSAAANTYVFGGTGSNRTLTITPALNQAGTSQITISVDDSISMVLGTASFTLKVNHAPTVTLATFADDPTTTPPTYITYQNTYRTLDFTIGDMETAADKLIVTTTWDNAALFPVDNIITGGTGLSRTLKLTPALNQTGTATITLTVQDDSGAPNAASSTTFFMVVSKADIYPPTISAILDQTMSVNNGNSAITVYFTVGDKDTPFNQLLINASSDNPTLLPSNDSLPAGSTKTYVFGGTGSNRTLTITPAVNKAGTAKITITVDDQSGSSTSTASTTFNLTVDSTPPQISGIYSPIVGQTNQQGTLAQRVIVTFSVKDPDTLAQFINVTHTHDNTVLVPNGNIILSKFIDAVDPYKLNCFMTIDPINTPGQTNITVMTDDGLNKSQATFALIVSANNILTFTGLQSPQITREDTQITIPFSVIDPNTSVDKVVVNAYSTSLNLVSNSNITLQNLSGGNYNLIIIPNPNMNNLSGDATIHVTANDGANSIDVPFTLTIIPVNDAPIISDILSGVSNENVPITVSFSVSDIDSTELSISASSSNLNLVPNDDLHISIIDGGISYGMNYILKSPGVNVPITPLKLKISPALNQAGKTTITIKAQDNSGSITTDTTTKQFDLTFIPILPGDVNGDGRVDLTDAILVLQVSAGIAVSVNPAADVNGDGKIGNEEFIYIIDKVSKILPIQGGDINYTGTIDISDAIIALQVLAGIEPNNVFHWADLNNDGKIGFEEVIYILQKVSKLR